MQTSARHIYAAGDVIGGYMFTHVSTYEARLAMHNLLGSGKIAADYRASPRVVFITPEIASVGLSEADCLRRDLRIKKAVVPIGAIARANTSNFTDGFVKIITDKNGLILGATIASLHAGEMIHELSLAIQYGLTASEVAAAIHAFPTWSEAIRLACSKIK
jgi:dihydrolipoamide dehydrogenase